MALWPDIQTQTHTDICTHKHTHRQRFIQTQTQAHTQTHTHTHTQTHRHTHAHTRTYHNVNQNNFKISGMRWLKRAENLYSKLSTKFIMSFTTSCLYIQISIIIDLDVLKATCGC